MRPVDRWDVDQVRVRPREELQDRRTDGEGGNADRGDGEAAAQIEASASDELANRDDEKDRGELEQDEAPVAQQMDELLRDGVDLAPPKPQMIR